MASVLSQNAYGKSSVRLTKVRRTAGRHELIEMTIDVLLEGDFENSYTQGDNRSIIATDSMKNTVYVLAKENDFRAIEEFAGLLCRHFKSTYAQVSGVSVSISEKNWRRLNIDGGAHAHAFVGGSAACRTCRAKIAARSGAVEAVGGVAGLELLKTTGSEFCGFVTDRYRTLKDTKDRILATRVEAEWSYGAAANDFDGCFAAIRGAMVRAFALHHSLSVQQTLLQMGDAALGACPAIDSIELKMPNQHRIPVNLEPFGIKDDNEIFLPVDEPFGMITGVVKRG